MRYLLFVVSDSDQYNKKLTYVKLNKELTLFYYFIY